MLYLVFLFLFDMNWAFAPFCSVMIHKLYFSKSVNNHTKTCACHTVSEIESGGEKERKWKREALTWLKILFTFYIQYNLSHPQTCSVTLFLSTSIYLKYKHSCRTRLQWSPHTRLSFYKQLHICMHTTHVCRNLTECLYVKVIHKKLLVF